MCVGHYTGMRFRGNKQVYTVDVSREACKISGVEMQDRLCDCLSKGFGLTGHLMPLQQVLMDELMDYLTLCYLHPTPPLPPASLFSHPPPPFFFLLLLPCGEMRRPPVCCVCISL